MNKLEIRADYIREHRKMWHWIADNLDDLLFNSTCKNIEEVKIYYISNVFEQTVDEYWDLTNYCFCCEYALRENDYCESGFCYYCPLKWDVSEDVYRFMCESLTNKKSNWYNASEIYSSLYEKEDVWNKFDYEEYDRLKEICNHIAELEEVKHN